MAGYIPFTPSDNNYLLGVTLDDQQCAFDTRWNSYEKAWYFDLYDAAGEIIAIGVKVVLGPRLGRHHPHPFFKENILKVVDTTGEEKDAGYDDLGGRVQVLYMTLREFKYGERA